MKSLLVMLSLLVLVTSCGDTAPTTADNADPGDERTFQPITVEPETKARIRDVCAALEEKVMALDDYVTRGTTLSATYQESDCDGKLSAKKNMTVAVAMRNGRHEFVADAGAFGLPEVETLASGAMKEICANLDMPGLRLPLETASNIAIDYRIVETTDCRTDSQRTCVQVMRGPINADRRSYRVSLISLLSFESVRGDRPGFYEYKNEKTFGSCGGKKYRTKIATF